MGHGHQPLPRRDAPGGPPAWWLAAGRQPQAVPRCQRWGLCCPLRCLPVAGRCCAEVLRPRVMAARCSLSTHAPLQMVSYLGPQQPVLMASLARWIRVRGPAAPPTYAPSQCRRRPCRCCCGLRTPCASVLPSSAVCLLAGVSLGSEKPCAGAQALGGGPAGTGCMLASWRRRGRRRTSAPAAGRACLASRETSPLLPPSLSTAACCRSGTCSRRSWRQWCSRPARR